jgi:signal transduction histidine kinase
VKKAQALQQIVSSTLEDLGRLVRGLHPQVLDDLCFQAAVERHAAEVSRVHGLAVDVEFVGRARGDLSMGTATALYRLVQEALTNAVRHGKAQHVSLVVLHDDAGIDVTVEDDGCGFDVREESGGGVAQGLGLRSIRERVALLGGSVEIDSTPGIGTTLIARVPLSPDAAHG